MDKPISLSVKDFLIRRMAVKMMLSEKTIDAVVSHQFSAANEALLNNKSVEISGFGKFLFNEKKARKQLDAWIALKRNYENQLTDDTLSEQKRRNLTRRLESVTSSIDNLKPKIYGNDVPDIRGVEEQFVPLEGNEIIDSENERGEIGDL